MTMLELMFWPFFECLILVGIHSYLGIHVLRRKVIFVDLAFAQIAALGTTVAFLFGLEPGGPGAYVFSLIFAMVAAAVFAITRLREERIPQEAIIGLTYALAASAAILVVDRAPHGAEHIKDIMAGSLLWVNGSDVLIAGALYAVVGLFHYIFRERFLLISTNADEARRRGIRVQLWDFLFYMSFGLVISLSVRVAGVLLVFVFLVVPAMLATLLTSRLKLQLVIGWTMGTVVTVFGLALSSVGDFPAGPAVVTLYGAVLVVVSVLVFVLRSGINLRRNLRRVALGMGALLSVTGLMMLLGNAMADSSFWSAHHDHEMEEHLQAVHARDDALATELSQAEQDNIHDGADPAVTHFLEKLLKADYTEKEQLLKGEKRSPLLLEAFQAIDDEETRLLVASRLHALSPEEGEDALLEFVARANMPFMQNQAAEMLVTSVRPAVLSKLFSSIEDEDVRLETVHSLAKVDVPMAVERIVDLLESSESPEVREESVEILSEVTGRRFGYAPEESSKTAANRTALGAVRGWIERERDGRPHRRLRRRGEGRGNGRGRGRGQGRGTGAGQGLGRGNR